MAQAADIHVNWTPRGWMRRDPLLGFEQHRYLRQPGYGASYITGGRLMEDVIAERARQLGDSFTLQRVMDEINRAGMIPPSLVYWEVTVTIEWCANSLPVDRCPLVDRVSTITNRRDDELLVSAASQARRWTRNRRLTAGRSSVHWAIWN